MKNVVIVAFYILNSLVTIIMLSFYVLLISIVTFLYSRLVGGLDTFEVLMNSPLDYKQYSSLLKPSFLFSIIIELPIFVVVISSFPFLLIIIKMWLSSKMRLYLILTRLGLGTPIKDNNSTFGSAEWMTKKELTNGVSEGIFSHSPGIILGIHQKVHTNTIKKKNIIRLGDSNRYNKHVFVCAPSGSGKSYSFVMPSALDMARNGASMLFTDPKGELYDTLSEKLRIQGYTIYLLDFINMMQSMRFNVFAYIETEVDVKVAVNNILKNTELGEGIGGKGDPFWERAETSLLQAVILYLHNYRNQPSLPMMFDFIVENDNASLEVLFMKLPAEDVCKKAFSIFLRAPEALRGNIILGLASRLDSLIISEVRYLTGTNDIDILDLKRKKTALFIKIPDTHNAFRFIISLFISTIGIKVIEYTDTNKMNPIVASREVYAFLDEFRNIGAIPNFTTWLATFRSRKFHLIPILQNMGQLTELYGDAAETIIGNCDTKLFLGIGDIESAEYVSKMLGSKGIIDTTRTKENLFADSILNSRMTIKDAQRNLMNIDELFRLDKDNLLVFRRGCKPLLLNKMPYHGMKHIYPDLFIDKIISGNDSDTIRL